MEKRLVEVIRDLRHFLIRGQIDFHLSNFKYYQMFCYALEATGMFSAEQKYREVQRKIQR
ncbi:hypothetical protein [Bacillus thuringiensis]|uniref:hypothetical protein n=1 Tax=Bacillus thuringiensis TaxID=1428 RepID=UPI000A391F8C|nr:hypothetical protein [Bacillus thuringiensis]OUA90147.1 hypothetical protein BK706_14500 [Bacillus thuringiensis serovar leesis]